MEAIEVVVASHEYPAALPALLKLQENSEETGLHLHMVVDAIEFFRVLAEPAIYVNGIRFQGLCAAYKGFAPDLRRDGLLFVCGTQSCIRAQSHLDDIRYYPLTAHYALSNWCEDGDRFFYATLTSVHKYTF